MREWLESPVDDRAMNFHSRDLGRTARPGGAVRRAGHRVRSDSLGLFFREKPWCRSATWTAFADTRPPPRCSPRGEWKCPRPATRWERPDYRGTITQLHHPRGPQPGRGGSGRRMKVSGSSIRKSSTSPPGAPFGPHEASFFRVRNRGMPPPGTRAGADSTLRQRADHASRSRRMGENQPGRPLAQRQDPGRCPGGTALPSPAAIRAGTLASPRYLGRLGATWRCFPRGFGSAAWRDNWVRSISTGALCLHDHRPWR